MRRENVTFSSDGLKLKGHFYLPEEGTAPYPVVVMAGGWCYVKELIQPDYAKFFADSGVAVLTFDYRNLGESEGEPRQHINPWEQIYDIINAITYVSLREDVDPHRVGVWGISYAGGHVFPVAALDPRVKTIFSIVPVLDAGTTRYVPIRMWACVRFGSSLRRTASSVSRPESTARSRIQRIRTISRPRFRRQKRGPSSNGLRKPSRRIMNTGRRFRVASTC